MRTQFESILFDIDGTLVDSTPAVTRVWTAFAAQRGLDIDHIMAISHGRRTEDTLAELIPATEVRGALAQLDRMERGDLDGVITLPTVADILHQLPASRWAAVTSGAREVMENRLRAAGLPVPRVLVIAEDVTAGKPDPQGYLAAAAALGVDPSDCLVVEDAPAGILAGRASGPTVLGVATSHDATELTDADEIVPNLSHATVSVATCGLSVRIR
ncbi:MAG: HAD-IA family hydrolase [Corynebacterium sp.]|uniref:HAD-IA family hydrolase n=1 Tax=Corynebacterium TaxID=1716 RepID=UPI002648B27E|nr:HAD-IA family hydrolase [Corynebacterium sp.]MDN5721560.1 HAD-IA family hydrolase [Corynebacterium sp.]MDN6281792.1 HAD-IA family hydrolase [Corynebacterium sp.]MDN6305936.1 HAD-IA family hydrolase [Corynebacterium sp.]MDN6352237.1 HAD-IA family hydrolase [Corynebacterium sp.]MDN6367604.1 HAD-IA family hydrolase [Corynebacterium sp.]